MRRLEDLVDSEPRIFGPGTDLVISLAAVLLLVLVFKSIIFRTEVGQLRAEKRQAVEELAAFHRGQVDLEQVLRHQHQLVVSVANQFNEARIIEEDEQTFGVNLDGRIKDGQFDIVFYDDVTLQRIAFGSHILFAPDDVQLSLEGRRVLSKFTHGLLVERRNIKEIQIQGHADTTPSQRYASNLELAALRAVTVFRSLQEFGVSPYEIIMSATSFGGFMSIQRFHSHVPYSRERLELDNRTGEQKRLNRRIELLLIYRR